VEGSEVDDSLPPGGELDGDKEEEEEAGPGLDDSLNDRDSS
jgi:hypothetical protein